MSSSGPGMSSIGAWDAKYGPTVFNLFPIRLVRWMDMLWLLPTGHAGRALRWPVYLPHFFAIQRLGSRVRARPCTGRSDEWISSGSFLQVMPAGHFDDHRPVYPRQVIIEDIGPSKPGAGNEAPELVFLVSSHQLHINPFSQVLHGLPEDRVVHHL